MTKYYKSFLTFLLVVLASANALLSQTSIEWQKTYGTTFYDNAFKIINDEDGNIIILGNEAHQDILTGDIRDYLMVSKLDPEGNEIWKTYHDVPHQTNSVPTDYGIGDHFYTEESGAKILNLVIYIAGNFVLYKLFDENGQFNYFDYIATPILSVSRDNVKITGTTSCSVQLSCYGPDSLTITKVNPEPDSNFNTLVWAYGLKQDIRTAPIQGHYDFDNNDIAEDEEGNVYLLTQIERWDFNFCTDCNDVFVDAYSMIFKLSPDGELIEHFRLNTTTAVVSSFRFLELKDGKIVIRVDDINDAGTALLTTIYHLDYDLNITGVFDLDRFYNHVLADENQNIYTVTNVFGNDPNIIGESDVLVTKFNNEGVLQWRSYYGGSSFDFPRGFVLTPDDGIAILTNTESDDFDVEEFFGWQDMWLIKLNETTTAVGDESETELTIYPNPATDQILFSGFENEMEVTVSDVHGRILLKETVNRADNLINVSSLIPGSYVVRMIDEERRVMFEKLVKQ